jgi:long-subunit fatty acid transport protein
LVGVDSVTAVAVGTIALENRAEISEISVTFLNMALLMGLKEKLLNLKLVIFGFKRNIGKARKLFGCGN